MHCTIVVPCYNTEHHIRECLDSCLSQTYQDYDILCVDDGSSDSTLGIVEQYCRGKGRDKLSLVVQSHKGVQHALQLGFYHAKGPVITVVDSDDRVLPCALEAVMPSFADADVGFAWSKFVTSQGKPGWSGPVPPGQDLYTALMSGWWRAAHHKFFRKSTLLKTWGLSPDFDRSVDFELALLLASTGCKYQHVNAITYWYRQGRPGSITSQGAGKQRETVERIRQWISQSHSKPV